MLELTSFEYEVIQEMVDNLTKEYQKNPGVITETKEDLVATIYPDENELDIRLEVKVGEYSMKAADPTLDRLKGKLLCKALWNVCQVDRVKDSTPAFYKR